MKGDNIKDRTLRFAIRVMTMINALPKESGSQIFARQVVRSVSSAGANYRAGCRSKSRRDFVYKLKTVEEELDETSYWLELIRECNFFPAERIEPLLLECNELLAIIVKSITTARENGARQNKKKTAPVEP
jgi:four helix bundle protein